MTLKEAREYINYNIKEGVFDESTVENMTDEELIKFAEDEQLRADLYCEECFGYAQEEI